jgi:hypothetical protein
LSCGSSVTSLDHKSDAGQTENRGRQEKYGRQNRALLPLMLEQLQARKQEERQTDKRRENSTKSKRPKHRPLRGIRQGHQKYHDAENQQYCIAAEYQPEVGI